MSTDRNVHSDVECFSVLCQYDSNISFCPDEIKSAITKKLLKYCMDVKRDSEDPYILGKTVNDLISDDFVKLFLVNITAKVCFLSNVDDSALVARVLNEIYKFHGQFRLIFHHYCGLQKEGSTFHHINLIRPTVNVNLWGPAVGGFIIIEYFLYHATKEHLLFENVRFVDLTLRPTTHYSPLDYVLYSDKSPKLLLLLLRYGAQVKVPGEEGFNGFNNFLELLLTVLWTRLRHPTHPYFIDTKGKVQFVNIMLRAIPEMKFGYITPFLNNIMEYRTNVHDFVKDLVESYELPKLQLRLFGPSELQHLCRCIIRKHLHMNWMLPFGIKQLPIPERLRRYIDLFED